MTKLQYCQDEVVEGDLKHLKVFRIMQRELLFMLNSETEDVKENLCCFLNTFQTLQSKGGYIKHLMTKLYVVLKYVLND